MGGLTLMMFGTQPDRMMVVRLKAALPRSHMDRTHNFTYTIAPRAGKLHIYDLQDIQGVMRARHGMSSVDWDRAPTNNHRAIHMASSPHAAMEFLTQSNPNHPRCVPVEIRVLHVDRVYVTRSSNAQRSNDVRHIAASLIQSAARNARTRSDTRRNIFSPPAGPGYLAAMRRFRGMQS